MPFVVIRLTSVEYQRIPLDVFFLDWSAKHANLSKQAYGISTNDEVEGALTSIIFSALFIESFINHLAEEYVPADDFGLFDRCKKGYKNRSGGKLGNTSWKLHYVLNQNANSHINMDDPLLTRVDDVMQTRHKLVHYKPQEAARKVHRPLYLSTGLIKLDLKTYPIKIEPSLLEAEVRCLNAIRHYMTCRDVVLKWCDISGESVDLASARFPIIEEPSTRKTGQE